MGMLSFFYGFTRGAHRFAIDWTKVHPEEMPRLIGKESYTLNMLRAHTPPIKHLVDLGCALHQFKLFWYMDQEQRAVLRTIGSATSRITAGDAQDGDSAAAGAASSSVGASSSGPAVAVAPSAGSSASGGAAAASGDTEALVRSLWGDQWEVPHADENTARLFFRFEAADDLALGFLEFRAGSETVRIGDLCYRVDGQRVPFGSHNPKRMPGDLRALLPVQPKHDPRSALLDGDGGSLAPEERDRLEDERGQAKVAYEDALEGVCETLKKRALLPSNLPLFTVTELQHPLAFTRENMIESLLMDAINARF